MRRMNEEELNDEQVEQINALEDTATELLSVMSDGNFDIEENLEDIYDLIEYAQSIVEKNGVRAHFPAHIDDGNVSYTIDYTDEEIK